MSKIPLTIVQLTPEDKNVKIDASTVFSKYSLMLFKKYLPDIIRGQIAEGKIYRLFWLEGERNNTELLLKRAATGLVRYTGLYASASSNKVAELRLLNTSIGNNKQFNIRLPQNDYGHTWFLLQRDKKISTF